MCSHPVEVARTYSFLRCEYACGIMVPGEPLAIYAGHVQFQQVLVVQELQSTLYSVTAAASAALPSLLHSTRSPHQVCPNAVLWERPAAAVVQQHSMASSYWGWRQPLAAIM